MKLTTTVSRTAALTPQHMHRIRLNDEKGETVGTALTWTFAPHEGQPHGVTQIREFSADNTSVAMHLHGAIARTLHGLKLPDEHPVTHTISSRALRQAEGHFPEFRQARVNPQRKLLTMPLEQYCVSFPKRRPLHVLKLLPRFENAGHFLETLEEYASKIPNDRVEIQRKASESRNEKLRKKPSPELLEAISKFTDPDTNRVRISDLVRHLHPEHSGLTRVELMRTREYSHLGRMIRRGRKSGVLPEKQSKVHPVSVEGRMQHKGLVHWLLKNKLRGYLRPRTLIPYEDAVEIGLKAIDRTYPNYDPKRGKYSSLLTLMFMYALIEERDKRKKRADALDKPGFPLRDSDAASDFDSFGEERATLQLVETLLRLQGRKVTPKRLLLWGLVHLKNRTMQRVGEHFGVSRQAVQPEIKLVQKRLKIELQREKESEKE